MGAGGIGGIVAASLIEAGADVTAVSTNAAIRAAIDRHGYRVARDGATRSVRGRVVSTPEAGPAPYGVCVLATQPPSVEQATRAALPHLAPSAPLVVLQNGLCEERVAAIAGPERVIGAIVAWGASMPEPGCYERTARGGFQVGSFARAAPGPAAAASATGDAARGAEVARLAALLSAVGPTTITQNLRGARWSKLALNCAVSALGTIAGERLGPLVRVRRYRRLGLEIMTEAVAVARAEGVALERVAGTLDLAWIALSEADRARRAHVRLAAKHALLLAVGLRYRRLRSSMLAAIERGRPPAIDFLNGEVVARGARAGVPTPHNARVCDAVWAIARGQARSSRAALDALCDRATGARA
jgi:2-dehydropantoate 2-reductase